MKRIFVTCALVMLIASLLPAQSVSAVQVPGNANIYGSGLAVPPAPGGGDVPNPGGVLPVKIGILGGTDRYLRFNATGLVNCCHIGGQILNGPDGDTTHGGTNINPAGGISGIISNDRRMYLVGVFLGANQPAVAPATLNFSAAIGFT